MIKKYRRKQIYTAFRWTGDPSQIKAQPWEDAMSNGYMSLDNTGSLFVDSECGKMCRVNPGDWILRGNDGEVRLCSPDVFDALYEDVDIPAPVTASQELKIVQILYVPPVNLGYTGYLLALGSDGAIYCKNGDTKWHVHFHNRFADEKPHGDQSCNA